MRAHTNNFKNAIKEYGRQLYTYVYTYSTIIHHLSGDGSNSLYADEINSIKYSYDCDLLKSRMQTLVIDSKVEIPIGTKLRYDIGLIINNSTEYIYYGDFYVKKIEQEKDKKSWKVTCYDKMIETMVDYTTPIVNGSAITYPITIRDYLSAICTHLGISTINVSGSTFTNYNKEVKSEHYLDTDGNSLGYTFRDVLDDLAEATGSFIYIVGDDLSLKNFVTTGDTINEEYFSDKGVNIGKHYGPINTIVLSRAEADNLYYPSTLPANPCEFKISDNPILEQTNREDFIQGIYNKLNGLEFYLTDFQTKGILYYDLGDKYNVSIGGTTYPCLMLNDEHTRTTGLKEYIYCNEPKKSVTDYKYASSSDRAEITGRNASIKVDKANGRIDQIVTAVGDNGEVTTASIVQSINDSGSQIKLNADKVYINGVTFDSDQNMTITEGTINIQQAPGDNSLYTFYDNDTDHTKDEASILPVGLFTDRLDTNNNMLDIGEYYYSGFHIKDEWNNHSYGDAINLGFYDNNGNARAIFNGYENYILVKSIVAQESRPSSPNFNHQYPMDRASMRFDICSSSMNSSGVKPNSDGFLQTFFWDNIGQYDTQLFIPNGIGSNSKLQIRSNNGSSWSNNWKDIPILDGFDYGEWTPVYLNCSYSNYEWRKCMYIKLGKIVILVFHDRPTISSISGNGNAVITGLPYAPIWPQAGGGAMGTCMITNTNYVPHMAVNYDYAGIELTDYDKGDNAVQWQTGNGGWIDGVFVYICQ